MYWAEIERKYLPDYTYCTYTTRYFQTASASKQSTPKSEPPANVAKTPPHKPLAKQKSPTPLVTAQPGSNGTIRLPIPQSSITPPVLAAQMPQVFSVWFLRWKILLCNKKFSIFGSKLDFPHWCNGFRSIFLFLKEASIWKMSAKLVDTTIC